jgi:spermidine/putrescine transport system substrate-binding protein
VGDRTIDRRQFLTGTAGLVGLGVLSACAKAARVPTGSGSQAPSSPVASHPPISAESGKLSLLDWQGYEAHGTKAQTYGLLAGKEYTDKYGTKGLTYTYIVNDDQALQKATSGGPFDVMHPCNENIPDYINRGLVQPWDTSLIPSFSQLNPNLAAVGKVNGKQYFIPWDWGYGSLLYRTDKIDAAGAAGWELAWNPKYKGKISLWNGASTNFEIAALKLGFPKMDALTPDQLTQAKQSLIEQKPLNKLYWGSEYGQEQPNFKSGAVWITYAWQDSLVSMTQAGVPCQFLTPSQGRLSWICGFMLGAKTQNYYHAHEFVESYINHDACADLTNLFYYGNSNGTVTASEIKDKTLVQALDLSNPQAVTSGTNHLQSWAPNRSQLELAWQEVVAS